MQFPLYTSLAAKAKDKDLTIPQKADFMRKIDTIDADGQELMYALIKSYYLDNDSNDTLSIPYGGVLKKDKISFTLTEFPNKLRQILFSFLKLHLKRVAEDQEKEDILENLVSNAE